MAGTAFQATVGGTAVQLTDEAELAAAVLRAGVKVVTPADNSGKLYYGFSDAVTTSTGCHIPNGVPFLIAPAEFPLAAGVPDLTALHLVASAAAQTVTGVVY
jgi:hypothetical protein